MKGYAFQRPGSKLVGQPFATREDAEKVRATYAAKGWTKLVRVNMPKPLTAEERADLAEASKFLKAITKGVVSSNKEARK